MRFDDAYLRRTPTELLFGDLDAARAAVERILSQAAEVGVEPRDPRALAQLPVVSEILADVRPGGEEPHVAHAYASLVYFSVHALSQPRPAMLMDQGSARAATDPDVHVPPEWTGAPPQAAGYLQLPRNLFWVQIDPEGPAEAVDGIHWVHDAEALWVLVAAGMRPGRPGVSAVVLDRLPSDQALAWFTESMREGGDEFASTLPGGDLSGFLSLASTGEVLKLLVRGWTAEQWAEVQSTDCMPDEHPADADPLPSRLPYRRLSLPTDPDAARIQESP